MKLSKILTLIKKDRLKSSQGFSLVELMVVVAIIGILAAIAIPNYQKFQARSKQTEARTQLSGIYAAEVTFGSEWGYGTANLLQMGYAVDGSNMRYNCGWHANQQNATPSTANVNQTTRIDGYRGPIPPAADLTKVNTFVAFSGQISESVDTGTAQITEGSGATYCDWAPGPPTACSGGAGCSAHSSDKNACENEIVNQAVEGSIGIDNTNIGSPRFVISCAGDIDGGGLDEWTMSTDKTLTNIKVGI